MKLLRLIDGTYLDPLRKQLRAAGYCEGQIKDAGVWSGRQKECQPEETDKPKRYVVAAADT